MSIWLWPERLLYNHIQLRTKERSLKISVKLFAGYRERVGRREIAVELPATATVGYLAREIASDYPGLIHDPSRLVVAVNQKYQDHLYGLDDGDEVALIPPVSGGSYKVIQITDEPLDPDEVTASVRRDSSGAVVTFLGTTRDHTLDRKVIHLEYEAYRPMAQTKLSEIADEMKERWPVEAVAIAHRLGRLEIGEISLVVAVASQHRKDAFEACQYSVDRIKQTVPIWKKEYFEGGAVWVESPDDIAMRESAGSRG